MSRCRHGHCIRRTVYVRRIVGVDDVRAWSRYAHKLVDDVRAWSRYAHKLTPTPWGVWRYAVGAC